MREAWRRAAAAAVLALAGCAAPDDTFQGVPWGTGAAELPALLAERGYELLTQFDGGGDQMYAGVFRGHRSLVVARVGEAGLAKVLVGVVSAGDRRAGVYHELAAALRERHGEPLLVEGGHAPGAAESAHGSVALREVWELGSGGGASYLILEDRPAEGVVLSFESPSWARELQRRRLAELRGGPEPGSAEARLSR